MCCATELLLLHKYFQMVDIGAERFEMFDACEQPFCIVYGATLLGFSAVLFVLYILVLIVSFTESNSKNRADYYRSRG